MRIVGSAHDAGHAELAGNHRGVGGGAAFAGQDALGSQHTVHVIRLGERAHHDHILLVFLGHALSGVGVEVDLANRRARGGIHALGVQAAFFLGCFLGFQVELRVQQGIDLLGGDAHDGFFLGDQAFVGHIHGDLDRGLGGALAVAGLQHPQLAALDGELHILHIVVVLFQLGGRFP